MACLSLTSKIVTGTFFSPANFAAWYRLSPAKISYLSEDSFRTTIGFKIPFCLID